jgi:hypothetical protein
MHNTVRRIVHRDQKNICVGATKPFDRPSEVCFTAFLKGQVILEVLSAPYRTPEECDTSGANQEVRQLGRQRVNNSGSDSWRVTDDDNSQTASRRKFTGRSRPSLRVQVDQLSTCAGCSFADRRLGEFPGSARLFNWDGQRGWSTLHRRPVIAEKKNLSPVEPGKGTSFIGERCCRAATSAKNTRSPTSAVSGQQAHFALQGWSPGRRQGQ